MDKLRSLRLAQIIMFLYSSGLIDQPTYSKMFRVKDRRDDLAHEPFTEINPMEAERLIRDAIECLEYLGVADFTA